MSDHPDWDPTQYHRYGDLRLRPALELFARINVANPSLVHDIGTGGGEIARLAAARWPEARIVGSDTSPQMLAKARATDTAEAVEWMELDIATWRPEPKHSVIYGNAVLHWVDDHADLMPRLVGGLVDGGQLAVQMPMSWWQPSHEAIRESLAALGTPEAGSLAEAMARPNVEQPGTYYDILQPVTSALDIWTTEYQQVLDGADPVFEWISGSILRPVFAGLPDDQLATFEVDCKQRLRTTYPASVDGRTLFPFSRVFIVATR